MYELITVDDVAVLNLSGEVNHSEMSEINKVIGELMRSSKRKVILNFQKVDHVNYKTLQHLLEQAVHLRSLSGDLKCASLNHYNQKIFRFTGVDQVVESYDSVYDAVMSFNGAQEKHRTWH